MSNSNAPKGPADPKVRANIYGLAALYLAYLFYRIAKPYLTRDPHGPTAGQFWLGAVILGGGAAASGFLAWRMYRAPRPEESAEEDAAPAPEDEADRGEP